MSAEDASASAAHCSGVEVLGTSQCSPDAEDGNKCVRCAATHSEYRCSLCQMDAYCSSRCQALHWAQHRTVCRPCGGPYSFADAKWSAKEFGVDTSVVSVARLLVAMNIEREHGTLLGDRRFNVTQDDAAATAKIALAHFSKNPGSAERDIPDYYILLARAEKEAEALWEHHDKPSIFIDPSLSSDDEEESAR